jgi:hypothetical protein
MRIAFVAIPLGLLILDVLLDPTFFETRDQSSDLSGAQLLRVGSASLGSFKGRRIHVSLDDIDDPSYLSFAVKGAGRGPTFWRRGSRAGNTLAISIVHMTDGWGGNLLSHVMSRLESGSSDDRDNIIDLLLQAKSSPNEVLWYDFWKPGTTRQAFPIDHLLLLKLEEQKQETYPKKIRELLDLAGKEQLSTLVVPCLGRSPGALKAKGTEWLTCSATYAGLFEGLKVGDSPRDVYLSFYKQWTDATIAQEAESVEATWKAALAAEEQKSGALPVIYQADTRLMLLFLFICLLVCSFRIELTLKTFIIICVSFVAVALELQDKATPLLSQVFDSIPAWVIKAFLLTVLSVGYVFFAGLDFERVFKTHGKQNKPQDR